MSRLADLLLKEDRTGSETDELRQLVDNVQFATDDVSGLFGPTGQIRSLKAGAVELDSEGFKTATRQVVIDRGGIQLGPSGAAASSIIWLAEVGGTQIGSILTTVVGASPDRYGLLAIRAEPESGTVNAAATGWVTISSYDHDGAGDDVRRGRFQLVGGNGGIVLYATNGAAINEFDMNQTSTTLNDQGKDVDTVIESKDVTDAWKLDAGTNAIQNGVAVEYEVETITASSDTLDHTNYVVLCDCSSNAITVTLPAVNGITGRVYYIKKIDSTGNTVTVDGNSSETIDGSTTVALTAQYESITIQNNGTEWFIL